MTILFITGLSGVGKTSVLSEMKSRGYKTVDLDYGYVHYQNNERLFNEIKVNSLLSDYQELNLILAGTESNQGQFYSQFDEVLLLTAELETLLERIKTRTSNPYGQSAKERQEVIESYKNILPLLKKRASLIIDTTSTSIQEVCDQLEMLYESKEVLN